MLSSLGMKRSSTSTTTNPDCQQGAIMGATGIHSLGRTTDPPDSPPLLSARRPHRFNHHHECSFVVEPRVHQPNAGQAHTANLERASNQFSSRRPCWLCGSDQSRQPQPVRWTSNPQHQFRDFLHSDRRGRELGSRQPGPADAGNSSSGFIFHTDCLTAHRPPD